MHIAQVLPILENVVLSHRNLYQINTPLRPLDWNPAMPYTVSFEWCEESGVPIGDIPCTNGLVPMTREEAAAKKAASQSGGNVRRDDGMDPVRSQPVRQNQSYAQEQTRPAPYRSVSTLFNSPVRARTPSPPRRHTKAADLFNETPKFGSPAQKKLKLTFA